MTTPGTDEVFRAIAAYLPPLVVEERLLRPSLPDVYGQFRRGTLVFADVSGFTAMSEKLSEIGREGAEELTNILNRYFSCMLDVVFAYGGHQLKFGGDAMLLLFLGRRHASRGARCALQMQKAMRSFRRVGTSRGTFKLEMSIGINTGEFFECHAGLPGRRLHYVLTGHQVECTARIEAASRAGEVLIGPKTLALLGHGAEVDEERDGYHRLTRLAARLSRSDIEGPDPGGSISEDLVDRLACYLPQWLADRVRSNPQRPGIDGEHRRVAVMFVNVLGASELIRLFARRRIDETTRALNEYFSMVQTTVDKYGGMFAGSDLSTQGDKLLIVFGAPVAHEDDDERAVLCALEMKERLESLNLPLRQRIGINSGYAFSGEVGSPLRKEYTVMGDQVNLAARLMGAAKEGQVLIGQSTHSRAANRFLVKAQEPIRVKGKSQPVVTYEVMGMADRSIPDQRLSTGQLVGRRKEMAALEVTVERVLQGSGHVVAITGPVGMGKSRLMEELKVVWERHGGLTCSGTCESYGTNTPYLPWTELLSSLLDLRASEPPGLKREKIEATIGDLCPQMKDWAALVGNLVHVQVPESELLRSLDPKLRRERLFDAVLELVRARAETTPLLLTLDDLHIADSASIELLEYVARNITASRVLVCVTRRSGEPLGLEAERQDNFINIVLGELSPEYSLDLARSIASMREMPEELSQLLVTKSQGNPLFVEEVVRSLIDAGHLRMDARTGDWELTEDLSRLQVPDTLQDVIMARLDQLEHETRAVLRVASVIGQHFQYRVLKDIYPTPISDEGLLQSLDSLNSIGLTALEIGQDVPQYCFTHNLTQEVAYESLLFAQRRELHRRIGEYFEICYAERLEEQYEVLAHHFLRSRTAGKALSYSVRAADKARRMFANREAISYYRDALQLAGEMPDGASLSSKLQEDLGDVYELTGRYELAMESYAASQQWYENPRAARARRKPDDVDLPPALLPSNDRGTQIAVLYRKRGTVFERKGQYDDALGLLDRAMPFARSADAEKARVLLARTGVLFRKGEYAESVSCCQQGLEIAAGLDDHHELAHAYYLLGAIHNRLGNIEKAIEYRRRSLTIYEQIEDFPGQARVHNNLGVDYYYLGDWQSSMEHYGKSLELREKIGDVNGVATVSNNMGEILCDQENLDEAVRYFLRSLKTWERTGYSLGVALSHSNLGKACIRRGNWEQAVEHLNRSLESFQQIQSADFLAEVSQRLAEAHLGMAQPAPALEWCERSLALASERNLTVVGGVARRTMGQIHRLLGNRQMAEEFLVESRDILRDLGVAYELGQTLWQLALLYQDMRAEKQEGKADVTPFELVDQATAIFERLGVRYSEASAAELRRLT